MTILASKVEQTGSSVAPRLEVFICSELFSVKFSGFFP